MADDIRQIVDFGEELSRIVKNREVDATSLDRLYSMWVNFFFDRILRIFEWDGLPFPQRELEGSVILNGISFIAWDSEENGFITRMGSVYGVTRYPDVYTTVIYAAPKEGGGTISGHRDIGKDAVVLYNTSNGMSLMPFIERYASLATHIDLSLKSCLINNRYTDILMSADAGTQESIEDYYRKKYEGIPAAILDETLLMTAQGSVNLAQSRNLNESSLDLIHSHNELLRSFYRDIGLRVAKEKSAEMSTSEVEANDNMLLFNINDMLRQRIHFCDEVNRIFSGKLHISVRLNDEFLYNIERRNDNAGEANSRTVSSISNYRPDTIE